MNIMGNNLQLANTLLKRSDFIGKVCKKVELREFIIKECGSG